MPDFILLGQCECGCGERVRPSKRTDYNRMVIKGFPGRYQDGHSNNVREPVSGLCQCGCNQPAPEGEFFLLNHAPDRLKRELLRKHVCPGCRKLKLNRLFPPYRPGLDYVCKDCQDIFRKTELISAIQQQTGFNQLCKCGCGWPSPISTYNSDRKNIKKGEPLDFIPSHAVLLEENLIWYEDEHNQPMWINKGHSTPCLERAPDAGKRGITVFIPNRPNGRRYPRVEELAWEAEYGVLHPGQHVLQKCGNLSCENLDHLEMRDLSPNVSVSEHKAKLSTWGYCKCGCGQKTAIATRTVRSRNWEKDKPKPYILGHHSRGLDDWEIQETIQEAEREDWEEQERYRICIACDKKKYSIDFKSSDPPDTCKWCAAKQRLAAIEAQGGMLTNKQAPATNGVVTAMFDRMRVVPDYDTVEARGHAAILTYPMPFGICRCGCGKPTSVATFNDPSRGYVKGMPFLFIKRHRRKNMIHIIEHPQRLRTDRTKECTNCLRELWNSEFNNDMEREECNECAGIRPIDPSPITVLRP